MRATTRRKTPVGPAFVLVIVSFLLSTTVSLFSLHTMNRNNMREMNKILATQVFDYIKNELSGPIMASRTMSSSSLLVDALMHEQELGTEAFSQTMADYLTGIEGGLGYQSAFVVSEASDGYYTRDGLIRTIDPSPSGTDVWYASFAQSRAQYDLDVDNDEQNPSDLTVYVNARIKDRNRAFLGICGVGVRMTGIQELFLTFEESFDVKISLVNADGVVQIDTSDANIEKLDLGDMITEKRSNDYIYEELAGGGFAVTKYVRDLDWYLIVQSDEPSEAGQFANVIALNVGLCAFVLIVLFVALRINRQRTDELHTASFIDAATGLLNRRAFESDKADLLARGTDPDLVCVTADVNGLKTANDTLGHDAGDELIRGAADCLRTCFEPRGKVYRTGGDEFAALVHVHKEDLERLQNRVEQVVAGWSGEKVGELSVSCGYAPAWEFPDEDVADLNRISDQRMYAAKEAHYAQTGRPRRT